MLRRRSEVRSQVKFLLSAGLQRGGVPSWCSHRSQVVQPAAEPRRKPLRSVGFQAPCTSIRVCCRLVLPWNLFMVVGSNRCWFEAIYGGQMVIDQWLLSAEGGLNERVRLCIDRSAEAGNDALRITI
jgi:hypothetical protein